MTEQNEDRLSTRKQADPDTAKAVYAKPRLSKLGLLRRITAFSF